MTTYTQITAANYDRIQAQSHEAHVLETNLNRHGTIWGIEKAEWMAQDARHKKWLAKIRKEAEVRFEARMAKIRKERGGE